MNMTEQLTRFLAPLTTRVRNMVVRGVIKLVDDKTKVQKIQASLLAGELKDGLERYQEYGLSTNPPSGTEALVVFCGGSRNNGVIVATGDRTFRLKELQPGEVALYTDEGDVIKLGRERKIQVTTLHLEVNATEDVTCNTKRFIVNASEKAAFTTPILSTSADFTAGGNVSDKKSTMQAMRDIYNPHTHDGDSGGKTGTPSAAM